MKKVLIYMTVMTFLFLLNRYLSDRAIQREEARRYRRERRHAQPTTPLRDVKRRVYGE
jgi:hypothetical protein